MTKEQFIDDLFDRMTIVVDRNRYGYIFFKIEDNLYMRYDSINGYLWCDWRTIWLVLSSKYGCNNLGIKSLIKGKVLEHFKLNTTATDAVDMRWNAMVLEHFKLNTT